MMPHAGPVRVNPCPHVAATKRVTTRRIVPVAVSSPGDLLPSLAVGQALRVLGGMNLIRNRFIGPGVVGTRSTYVHYPQSRRGRAGRRIQGRACGGRAACEDRFAQLASEHSDPVWTIFFRPAGFCRSCRVPRACAACFPTPGTSHVSSHDLQEQRSCPDISSR
jgi:hypothetical protein